MNASQAFKSRSMKSMLGDHLLRNGLSRLSYDNPRKTSTLKLLPGPSSSLPQIDKSLITTSKTHKVDSLFTTMNKLVKGKLSLVGVNKLFRKIFSVREGEKLLRAAHCCLSTTAGPISGRLFISTEKLAFCSDRPIAKLTSPNGDQPLRFHYKIVIPLGKIKKVNERDGKNLKKASQKYLQVVTADEFEFWFMEFINHNKTFTCLQQALICPNAYFAS
ncbi:unnamed protein product [Amaranthus hypochondriacus]